MEKVVKFAKTIRNNWKKSTVAALAASYGISKLKERYEIDLLMTAVCKEAAKYGDDYIPIEFNDRTITVILNPVANKRSSKTEYEKYCEPLFHLSGIAVNVVQTTSEGHAKEIVESLKGTEAIIVAGGDGTLSETVTGLLRRNDDAAKIPIGVLPLGRTNTIGNILFPGGSGIEKVKQLTDATMAIIHSEVELRDVMKIEVIQPVEEETIKPIFALCSVEWGAFRDAQAKRDKYWIWGPLREYATYIFNGYKNSITWKCSGTVKFSPPCDGCNNCKAKIPEYKSKWSNFLLPKVTNNSLVDYSKIINPSCQLIEEKCFKTTELRLCTANVSESKEEFPSLKLSFNKPRFSYTEFVSEGWNRLKHGKGQLPDTINARTIELLPNEEFQANEQLKYSIDNEEFDVKPIRITYLPKAIKVFTQK